MKGLLPRVSGAPETSDSKTPGSARAPLGNFHSNGIYSCPKMDSINITPFTVAYALKGMMRRSALGMMNT